MKLSEALSERRIKLNPESACRDDIIAELVDLAVADGRIHDADEFIKKVMAREAIQSTGLTDGIAIPHAQGADVDGVSACLGVCRNGIEFDSADGKPAQFVFVIAAGEHHDASYLSLLSRIVRMFGKARIREQVLAAQSVHDIIRIVTEEEEILTQHVSGSDQVI